jgi:hypothetical protein
MKTLEEKKLLVQMMKTFGQPIDEELVASIRREEELNEKFFGVKKEEKIISYEKGTTFLNRKPILENTQVLTEADPAPAPAFTPPTVVDVVQQTVNVLNTANANTNIYRDKELEGMRRTLAEMVQKINTLSWGGGGTGIVRIFDADDFDRNTVGEGKYMKWQNGWFVLDEINPFEVVYNTTIVTSNTYVVQDQDYYIGVNVPEYTTIILPIAPSSGRMLIVKDESGFAQLNPIKLDGNIDNDPDGAEIRINNGGVQLIYRNGWRIV